MQTKLTQPAVVIVGAQLAVFAGLAGLGGGETKLIGAGGIAGWAALGTLYWLTKIPTRRGAQKT